jgi:serine protease AprX
VQWDHPALRAHYRGWTGTTADHSYQWWDAIHDGAGSPCPNSSPAPCDDQGHGTHTTGTMIGDDGLGNQIGVAPAARWIGCRNMDRGFGTPSRYVECFQFFLAPTDLSGQNADPSRRPHVVNNSWTCPPSEGCPSQALQIAVDNLEAAGIFAAMAAGNSGGAGCGSVNEPPAIYAAAFSVGAYDASNVLAGFSSRGPVLLDGSNRLKPDLSGPGVNVRSAYPTNSYAALQGTSMATPHVAGAVALLWSARPELARDVVATRALLLRTANPNVTVNPPQTCGGISSGTIPNDSFGYGRVDALAVVNAAAATSTPTPTRSAPTATSTAIPPSATPTRTPTPSPTPSPCVPRPAVIVTSTPDGSGRLRATVAAGTGPGAPSNSLLRIEMGTLANAVLDVPDVGTGLTGGVTVPLPPGTQQTTFYVRRATAGQAATANFVVVDACGAWPTFVGGGPNAF